VRRSAIEIEVVLLDVFAVIAFVVGEPEEALLQDGVLAVPERERKAEDLAVVRDARKSVLPPPIRARPRLVVGEVAPCVAGVAVVLPDGALLALAQVRTPLLPRRSVLAGLSESCFFGVGNGVHA
jgi:hypothetical protein